jgi:heterotetrameric sarcosine oxidase gamma subunit
MSSLAFLHADVVSGGPVALSPLTRDTAAGGARFDVRDGWQVAASYGQPSAEVEACRSTVGFADMSHLGVLELQGRLDTFPDGLELRRGAAARRHDAWWCAATPTRALVICDAHATVTLREQLEASFAGHVLDLTTTYGGLAVAGPLARETFARFCALDLRPTAMSVCAFRPGSVARTPGYVLREAQERYLMLFGAAVASSIWEVVQDAAERLRGRAVGLDALDAAAPLAEEVPTHA